jgi:hypothetical protein
MVNQRYVPFIIAMALCFITGCESVSYKKQQMSAVYHVKKVSAPAAIDGNWNNGPWANTLPLDVKLYMGNKPAHQPKTQAKVLYDANAIYVMFRVEDRYVRAVAGHQGNVCRDSCVEFFFIAGTDTAKGYFNFEMNCGGTMVFHHQIMPHVDSKQIAQADCDKIDIYHSLPTIIDPEIKEPTVWVVQYRLPFDILEHYAKIVRPAPGVVWQANFYKCADATSHPHWLTWAKVNRPQPDFHVPDSFGELIFE